MTKGEWKNENASGSIMVNDGSGSTDNDVRVSLSPLEPATALRALLSTKRPSSAADDQD